MNVCRSLKKELRTFNIMMLVLSSYLSFANRSGQDRDIHISKLDMFKLEERNMSLGMRERLGFSVPFRAMGQYFTKRLGNFRDCPCYVTVLF